MDIKIISYHIYCKWQSNSSTIVYGQLSWTDYDHPYDDDDDDDCAMQIEIIHLQSLSLSTMTIDDDDDDRCNSIISPHHHQHR
ncbi:hypothetical protein DERF_012572, partial [Dermatophagoides farinae]